jgi:hypothetical protein
MGPVGPLEQLPGEGYPLGSALAAEGLCGAAVQEAVGLNCLLLGLFLLPLPAGQLAATLHDSTDRLEDSIDTCALLTAKHCVAEVFYKLRGTLTAGCAQH